MPKQHLTAIIGADARKFNRTMGNVRKSVGRIGKAVAAFGVAAGAGLVKLTTDAVNYGDAIDKAAKRTGLSAEAIQRLSLAANLSGADMESLEKGIKRMSSVILDAENGLTDAQRAMSRLGVSLVDVKGKTPEEQFKQFMNALAGVEDASLRSALAQDVFGRAGTQLLPLLSEGAVGFGELMRRADELGIVLGSDMVASAAAAKDRFTELKEVIKNIGFNAVLGDGEELATVLSELTKAVIQFRDEGGLTAFIENMKSLAEIGEMVSTIYGGISEVLADIGRGIEDFASGITKATDVLGISGVGERALETGTGRFGAVEMTEAEREQLSLLRQMVHNTNTLPMAAAPVT